MPFANSGKQPMSNGSSWNGEGSSSSASASEERTAQGSNSKVNSLLAAAPRLSLQDDESLQPPSYDDANSIRSVFLPAQPSKSQDLAIGVLDAVEFEYAFEAARSHEELVTSVVRNPGSKTTILSIQRLALGSNRLNPQAATTFKLTAVPLAADQLELSAKVNSEMAMRSIQVGMLDIADNDPDIQCGMIDWSEKAKGDLPEVLFERPYPMPPDVLMFLNTFSFKSNSPRRVRALLGGVGQQGFHPRFITGPSAILDAKAAWIAIPKDSMRFDSGTFEVSSKAASLNSITFTITGVVEFTRWKFPKGRPPKIFIGLAGFDRDYLRPFRYSAAVTGKSHKGFSWTVRSWDDSNVACSWSVLISWIAIADSPSSS